MVKVRQYQIINKILFFIMLIMPTISIGRNIDVIKTVETSIKDTRVIKVELSPVLHSTAVMMTIYTTKRPYQMIISADQVQLALATLKKMNMMNKKTVFIPHQMTQHLAIVHSETSSNKRLVPGAAAIVASAVISANQQASK